LLGGYIVNTGSATNFQFESATTIVDGFKRKLLRLSNISQFPLGASFRCIFQNSSTGDCNFYSNPSGVTVGGSLPQVCGNSTVILEVVILRENQVFVCIQCPCDCQPPIPQPLNFNGPNEVSPPYLGTYNYVYNISWPSFGTGVNYSYLTTSSNPYIFVPTGPLGVDFYFTLNVTEGFDITVNGSNACGNTGTTQYIYTPCFLPGTLVAIMKNNEIEQIVIEDVKVGDKVVGAFGEINTVLALHRPTLGDSKMFKINDLHSSSDHHPHISVDKKFYTYDPSKLSDTYGKGKCHAVIGADGKVEIRELVGLRPGRVQKLEVGVVLQGLSGGVEVTTIEEYSLPRDTQLYNLVVSGSHTYFADGFAVTGFPSEEDFDYDSWKCK